jgi:hypothetical protein
MLQKRTLETDRYARSELNFTKFGFLLVNI